MVRAVGYARLRQRFRCRAVVAVSLVMIVPPAAGAQRPPSETANGAMSPSTAATNVPEGSGKNRTRADAAKEWRLHVPDPVGRRVASNALDLAAQKLARPDCAHELLSTFADQSGRPLSVRLGELLLDVQTYLTMVVFIDASREKTCARGAFAFTSPGSRVVGLCVDELKRTWLQNPEYAAARLIHEMLHTLGLGENPPSSATITRRVTASCK